MGTQDSILRRRSPGPGGMCGRLGAGTEALTQLRSLALPSNLYDLGSLQPLGVLPTLHCCPTLPRNPGGTTKARCGGEEGFF